MPSWHSTKSRPTRMFSPLLSLFASPSASSQVKASPMTEKGTRVTGAARGSLASSQVKASHVTVKGTVAGLISIDIDMNIDIDIDINPSLD